MLPKKEVKALEEDFAPILLKTTWISTFYDAENVVTYEFVVGYKIDGIFINYLNVGEYFLIPKTAIAIDHGVLNRNITRHQVKFEETRIENNSTIIYVRVLLLKTFVNNNYGGLEYIQSFFKDDSAFYVAVMYEDVAGYAYNEGFNDGYGDGYERGLEEGEVEGYIRGYDKGSEYGYNVGYEIGYDEGHYDGYDLGYLYGRDEGYNNGYTAGYYEGEIDGYNMGYDEGYSIGNTDGYEEGFAIGRNVGYNEGHEEGYSKGFNIGMNIQHNKFSDLLNGVFTAIGTFLGIRLFPGITIGAIIAIPIVFGIIAFILGRRRG